MSTYVTLRCDDCEEDGPPLRLGWQAHRATIQPRRDNPAYHSAVDAEHEAAAHDDWVSFFEAHDYHDIRIRWR